MPARAVVARAAPHMWEEPCVSGTRGSGTVFFSGCSLRCVYCQNHGISQGRFGRELTTVQLRCIFERLKLQGVHNINLVTPTHFVEAIGEALEPGPLGLPIVYNSSGYDGRRALDAAPWIDVYLPDFKYAKEPEASRFSSAPNYPAVAMESLSYMHERLGPCVFDSDGLIARGVIVRHLLLPGHTTGAMRIMDFVRERMPGALFSLMSQFTPMHAATEHPPLDRRLKRDEIERAITHMADIGLEGYVQDKESASDVYTPRFDLTGVEG